VQADSALGEAGPYDGLSQVAWIATGKASDSDVRSGYADTVTGMADLTVLFCADPLTPGRVDAHFAPQAAVVRDLGGAVALIDHDALLAEDLQSAVRKVPRDAGPVWYRGWMIPSAPMRTSLSRSRRAALRCGSLQTATRRPTNFPAGTRISRP